MNSKFAMKTFAVVALIAGLSVASWAGDIEGKVTGMKGKSVVYVEAIAGKTFPAPNESPGHGSKRTDLCAAHHGCATGHNG